MVMGKLAGFDDIAGKDRAVTADAEAFVVHAAGPADADAAFHVPVQGKLSPCLNAFGSEPVKDSFHDMAFIKASVASAI